MLLLLPALVAILLQPISMLPDMLKLPRSAVLHASSGLIFHYLSDYSPANRIASFTVSIPMTIDMCYLIPVNAIRKIPDCHQLFNASHQPSPRTKRFVTTRFTKQNVLYLRSHLSPWLQIQRLSAIVSLSLPYRYYIHRLSRFWTPPSSTHQPLISWTSTCPLRMTHVGINYRTSLGIYKPYWTSWRRPRVPQFLTLF